MKFLHKIVFILLSLSSSLTLANGYYGYGYGYPYPPMPAYGYPAYQPYPYYPPQAYAPASAPATEAKTPVPAKATNQPAKSARPVAKQETRKAKPQIKTVKPSVTKSSADYKQAFIDKLLPIIQQENRKILQQRQWLSAIFKQLDHGQKLSDKDASLLRKLGKSYRVKGSLINDADSRQELLDKLDIIPASLTLAQAANESGWGKSRFAREANTLFGIWTYDESKGLIPKNRDPNKKHFVRKFDSIDESIAYYMQMLNSHPAYAKLREIRAQLRLQSQSIKGHQLADGLEKYSAKGDKYISLIQQLISQNEWAGLDDRSGSA